MTDKASSESGAQTVTLRCPSCAGEVAVAEAILAERVTVRCLHCGVESELTREWVEGADTHRWALVDPETEAPDERR